LKREGCVDHDSEAEEEAGTGGEGGVGSLGRDVRDSEFEVVRARGARCVEEDVEDGKVGKDSRPERHGVDTIQLL
jgi:hypothetical protein